MPLTHREKPPPSSELQLLACVLNIMMGISYVPSLPSPLHSHIYQPVVDSLLHVAQHLEDREQRYELMMKALQVFVQQGIEAKRAGEKAHTSKVLEQILINAHH